ncbi:MAG: 2-oxo acid dehydrogenase subunit E2, partial [Myxococcales bacterium]
LYALALEIEEQVGKVRNRQDPAMEQGKKTLGMVPLFLINFMLKVIAFLTYALNLDMRRFGIPRDPFGSVTVTNIGSLGLDLGFVPLAPYTRVPLMVAVGAIKVQPVVEGEQVVPGKVMRLTSSFDHRLIDGFHASVLAKAMVDYLETPFEHLDKIEDLPATQETLATV